MICIGPQEVWYEVAAFPQRAVKSVQGVETQQADPATAVTSVMASQILAFDDSFTVK